jgi:hypothetical protein
MTTKHTPGPWLIHSTSDLHMNDRDVARVGDRLKVVSHTAPDGMTLPELQANARLIAAAPDLLAALEGVMALATSDAEGARVEAEWAESHGHPAATVLRLEAEGALRAVKDAEAVIDKARGRQ